MENCFYRLKSVSQSVGIALGIAEEEVLGHQLSVELFSLWGIDQVNFDPNTSQLERFWVVSMLSSFLEINEGPIWQSMLDFDW